MASSTNGLQAFDRRQLKVNQALVIGLLLADFLLAPIAPRVVVGVVLGVGLVMLGGALWPALNLFRHLYFHVLLPARLLRPDVVQDDPLPHRFANGLGGVFVLLGATALLVGASVPGWVLAWIVIGLASLNFTLNICVGCIIFHQLERLRLVPGRA